MSIAPYVIAAVGSLGSTLTNLFQANKRMKQAEAAIEQSKSEIAQGYNQAIGQMKNAQTSKFNYIDALQNTDYTTRPEIRKAYTDMANMLRTSSKQAANQQFITGASDAAINANKANMYNNLSNTFSNIASAASNYRDRLNAEKLRTMDVYSSALSNLYASKGSALGEVYQNKANYLMNLAAGKQQSAQAGMDNMVNTAMMAAMMAAKA